MIGLAFAAFVFNTSEFLPVGLLPDMAASLNESVSFMGLVITGYAWVVSIMSLPLALLTARFERKKLLLFLLGLFAICHFAVLWVDSFWSLYATRIGVALAHSIFWSIMNPLAARMAPAGKRATGLAAVMGGTIVATVLGVPLGTKMGHLFGWAESFFVIGAAAFLVLMLLWYVLPQCPSRSAGSLKSLPVILKRPALLQLYGVTMITMLGQFTAYSFISPILEHSAGMSGSDVVDVLLLFGLAGIIGTVLSSKTVDRYPSASLTVPLVVLSMSLFLLVPLCSSWLSLVPLLLLWALLRRQSAWRSVPACLWWPPMLRTSQHRSIRASSISALAAERLSDPSSRSISALRLWHSWAALSSRSARSFASAFISVRAPHCCLTTISRVRWANRINSDPETHSPNLKPLKAKPL